MKPFNQNTVMVKRIVKAFKKEAYDFSSVQCNLPEDISNEIIQWGIKNIPEESLDPEEGREFNIHVTVKYGIHIIDPFAVRELFHQQKPIKARLSKTTLFELDDYDVLKIDVISSDLHKLNKLISNNFIVTNTVPEYCPHITIAYLKKGEGKKWAGRNDFENREIIFKSAIFSGKDNRETLINFPA